MKQTHALTHIPNLSKSQDKETIHVDMNFVVHITEPVLSSRTASGGNGQLYSWFKIVSRDGIPELVIRSTDIGTYTWEQINQLVANRHEFPLASTRHLNKVFEAAYEAWTGKTYKIEEQS